MSEEVLCAATFDTMVLFKILVTFLIADKIEDTK